MKNLFFTILPILIISVLLFNSAGFLLIYLHLKSDFQKEALIKTETYIPSLHTEKISISKNDIRNNKLFQRIEEKEFRYKGNMYDIVKEVINKDSVIFYCINDKSEELLNEAFIKYIADFNSHSKTSSQKNAFHLLNLETILGTIPFQFSPIQNSTFYYVTNNFAASYFTEIPSPPPKLLRNSLYIVSIT